MRGSRVRTPSGLPKEREDCCSPPSRSFCEGALSRGFFHAMPESASCQSRARAPSGLPKERADCCSPPSRAFLWRGSHPRVLSCRTMKAPLARVEREPRAGCEIVTLDNCSVKGNCHFLRFRIILFHQWHCASLTAAVRRAPIICPLFYKLLELFGRFAKSA